jgi:hypothetical protein
LVATKISTAPLERSFVRQISRIEVWFAVGMFIVLLVLKLLFAFHYRIDSDEPQHLHVVWCLTRQMIPYRDYFDNHCPLFQILCAPLFAALGTRADIVVPMRLAMIPLFAVSLLLIARIVGSLVSARAGLLGGGICRCYATIFF